MNSHDARVSQFLKEIRSPDLKGSRLFQLWGNRLDDPILWRSVTADDYATIARRLMSAASAMTALEAANEGLRHSPGSLPLRQLRGLALARSGDLGAAEKILTAVWDQLRRTSDVEPATLQETLGALARVAKDRGLALIDPIQRQIALVHACEAYGEAYRLTGGTWTGINEATLATLTGDRQRAQRVAERVRRQCLEEIELPSAARNEYWLRATLGEAELNLQNLPAAEAYYRQTGQLGTRRIGDLNSTRKQARVLLRHFGVDPAIVDDWMPIPRVVVFSGHMLDRPERKIERFPSRLAQQVKATIKGWLSDHRALIGFSSAANGSDLLFQEALRELNGESHLILPYLQADFVQDSVAILGGEQDREWIARSHTVIDLAARVVQASPSRLLLGGESYDFANQMINGLAMMRARELDTPLVALAVGDGRPGDGPGGTASMIECWHQLQIPVSRIDLSSVTSLGAVETIPIVADLPNSRRTSDQEHSRFPDEHSRRKNRPEQSSVMALLFADAQGFSQLTDTEVPRFVERFLGGIAILISKYQAAIEVKETWGDGLFLAFNSVHAAGLFALELSDFVNATDWIGEGFQHPLRLRIALHAGPVYRCTDPITGQPKCCGTHVSQASRLEPATPAGQIYASEAFAALTALALVKDFRCDYITQLAWAKDYGSLPAYLVHRVVN